MTDKKTAKTPTHPDTHTLKIKDDVGKSKQRKLAEVQLSPTIINSITAQSFLGKITGEVDLSEAVQIMNEKSDKIIAGDLSELESTLAAQVVSLNAIFTTLARRSTSCEYLNQVEANLRLALKAQAQCARTIEVLAAIKNPPVIFARQANIAHGNQQINNGNHPPTHAGKTINSPNELLNEANHATLDTRRTTEAGGVNQELAAMETVNGR